MTAKVEIHRNIYMHIHAFGNQNFHSYHEA